MVSFSEEMQLSPSNLSVNIREKDYVSDCTPVRNSDQQSTSFLFLPCIFYRYFFQTLIRKDILGCYSAASLTTSPSGGGGGGRGGYSIYSWVGSCGPAPHVLTLFKTKIADFPTLFKTEFRFLITCLRHLAKKIL